MACYPTSYGAYAVWRDWDSTVRIVSEYPQTPEIAVPVVYALRAWSILEGITEVDVSVGQEGVSAKLGIIVAPSLVTPRFSRWMPKR